MTENVILGYVLFLSATLIICSICLYRAIHDDFNEMKDIMEDVGKDIRKIRKWRDSIKK